MIMKSFATFFVIFLFLVSSVSVSAQDVYISVPANNIFTRTEFSTVENIMNTGVHTNWRAGAINPKIWSNRDYFLQTSNPSLTLPTSILHWRLESIGGAVPRGGTWPGFKYFNTTHQTWYQPNTNSHYNPGPVAFTFKMPSDSFLSNSFTAGNYSLRIFQNYNTSGFYAIEFTPNNLDLIVSIPAAIKWMTPLISKDYDISSLNKYRLGGDQTLGNLGLIELGNTVDFNLFIKASPSIQFTSSKGVEKTLSISKVRLGISYPSVSTAPLSSTWQNYTPNNPFKVEIGNRNNFELQLLISEADFKKHFFEAGTYRFQLNLDAESIDKSISETQNTDITLKVLPQSEISIPASGSNINFQFNTASQYQNGQTKVIPNQLKISNNETYEVYVKSDTPFFKRNGIQSDISSNMLNIGIDGEGTMVALSLSPKKLISKGLPVLDKNFNVEYTILPNDAQSLVSKEKSTYSINVIYSFTAL